MKYRQRFHRLIREDRKKPMLWYRSQRIGLEQEFKNELLASFARIQQAPLSHAFRFSADIRFNLLHRFPYVIYFVIMKTEIRVLAVLHGRQDNSIVSERKETWPS